MATRRLLLRTYGTSTSRLQESTTNATSKSWTGAYRDLSAFDPMLDVHESQALPSGSNPRMRAGAEAPVALHLNNPPPFRVMPPPPEALFSTQQTDLGSLVAARMPITTADAQNHMRRATLVVKRVSHMTIKGRSPSWYALVVAGNGEGVVGLGEGRGESVPMAADRAFIQALKNLTAINRFEDRTTWGTRQGKWGACKMVMWARPPGARSAPCPSPVPMRGLSL